MVRGEAAAGKLGFNRPAVKSAAGAEGARRGTVKVALGGCNRYTPERLSARRPLEGR